MDARVFTRGCGTALFLAAVVAVPMMSSAWAGGGHGAGVFRAGAGVQGGGGVHGFGGPRVGGFGRLPPVSGVIHERPGTTPYVSAYGHVGTAFRPVIGRGQGLAGRGGLRRFGGLAGGGRLHFAGARRRFGYLGGYGGYGVGAPGLYGDAGVYGDQGTYGGQGSYGGAGTYATQGVYGSEPGSPYVSETPLALRFAEPPLAPSPYAPYSPADTYADTGSDAVGSGPRIVTVSPLRSSACDCGPHARTTPVVYRYGIGTAY